MPWLTQSAILQQLIGVLNLPILHQADAELSSERLQRVGEKGEQRDFTKLA